MRRLVLVSLTLALALSITASAQITIATNTYQPTPGTVIKSNNDLTADATLYNSLTSGSGGPMVWDFSTRTYGGASSQLVVNTATAPAIDSFPGVNLVTLLVTGLDSAWVMQQSTSSVFWLKGNVNHYLGNQQVIVYRDSSADWLFPLTYGKLWISHHRRSQINGVFHTDSYDTTSYSIDAWGTAKYLSKSVPCLRVVGHDRIINKTYNGATLLDSSLTEQFYAYFVISGFSPVETVIKTVTGNSTTYNGSASADFLNQQTDVTEDGSTLPNDYALEQNYPNPFNPITEIHFSLPRNSHVTLVVYNVLGEQVKTLVDQTLTAGSYNTSWDGTNQAGSQVASGVYLYRVEANQFAQTKKMVLLK